MLACPGVELGSVLFLPTKVTASPSNVTFHDVIGRGGRQQLHCYRSSTSISIFIIACLWADLPSTTIKHIRYIRNSHHPSIPQTDQPSHIQQTFHHVRQHQPRQFRQSPERRGPGCRSEGRPNCWRRSGLRRQYVHSIHRFVCPPTGHMLTITPKCPRRRSRKSPPRADKPAAAALRKAVSS